MSRVVLHPFIRFERGPLGEKSVPVFGEDVEMTAYGVDPGGSSEIASGLDSAVRTTPTIYFRREQVRTSAHSEWTVNGTTYKQDGEAAVWESPNGSSVGGTVIRLKRRTG